MRGYANLGAANVRLGNFRDAIAYFEKAIALEPDFAEGYHGIAQCYRQLGEEESGRKYMEQFENLTAKEAQ